MTLAVMQPYLFPYLGYFQLIHAVDRFVVYDDVNYIKKGWVNRNNILENGEARLFTVPLSKASQNSPINTIAVAPDDGWRDKLLKRITAAYGKAPQFNVVMPMVRDGIQREGMDVGAFNTAILEDVIAYLEIGTELVRSSSVHGNAGMKGADRILDICMQEKADRYVNAIGGKELYDVPSFQEQGILLQFLRSELPAYPQYGKPFVAGLSIIDVLMFNERDAVREMLDRYSLE
jgi:hypothetical protein